jgi:acetyl-CoA carboxylase carboxyltransferase component
MSQPNAKSGSIDTRGAVDLDAVKVRQAAEAAAKKIVEEKEAEERQRALEKYAQDWDNAMNRAFKGIVPRRTRHRMMRESAEGR